MKKEPVVNLDKEIKIIRLQTVLDNTSNREWCYWAESVCQSYSALLYASVVGSGLQVKCPDNKEAEKIIYRFNKKINASGMTMEDLVNYAIIDNSVHGFSTWRIQILKEEPYVDLGRLDAANLVVVPQGQESWTKFIYRGNVPINVPKSKREFLSPSYSPPYDPETKEVYNAGQEYEWHIPIESTLYFNLVSRPPMSAAMQYVLFKRWLLWFMRKSAEKSWMPLIVVTLGNEEINFFHDLSPQEQEYILKLAANRVAKLASFGVIAVKWGEEVKVLEDRSTAQARSQFVEQIALLDKEIIFAMGGSFGMANVDQTELGTQRQAENMLIRNVQALRSRIGSRLENFYINVLLPQHGIQLEPEQLKMDWSHVKEDRNLEMVQMATTAFEHSGLSLEEYRTTLKSVWDWIKPEETEKAIKDFKDYNEAMQKAQMPFGGSGQRAGSETNQLNKKVQPTRPYSQGGSTK